MDWLYSFLKFVHVMSFVFMTVPLFNLIVVNERAQFGAPFNYYTDRYMENIIKNGAKRCYIFQLTVFISGILLLIFGPLGISALWTNWILAAKTIGLFVLMISLSYVHFKLQPGIEALLKDLRQDTKISDETLSLIKPLRALRKTMATFCLFIVIMIIILGLQVYATFDPLLTILLVLLAGLFALRVNKTGISFGWL